MKIGALLSVRNKSTRFPGKVLKELYGQTVTEHLVDRMKMTKHIDNLIISTSVDERDAVFESIARKKNINIFRGSKEDKLKRYLDTAERFSLDGVVIIDGDNILCFPEIMDNIAVELRDDRYEAVFWKKLPLGAASHGLTRRALEKVMEIKAEEDTEVWGGYFTNSGVFKVGYFEPEDDLLRHPDIRLTMDYQEDLNFLKAVFDELYINNPLFSSHDLLSLLVNRKPDIPLINKKMQEKYEEHIAKATPIKFKSKLL